MCFNMDCNVNTSSIATTACPAGTGFCLATDRLGATGAKFNADRNAILITLKSAAKAGAFACDDVLEYVQPDSNATSKFGAAAQCSAAGSAVTVKLPASATIKDGAKISTTAAQSALVDLMSASKFNITAATLVDCDGCTEVVPIMLAPTVSSSPRRASSGSN